MDNWVGVDVSMETLDLGWMLNGSKKHIRVANNSDGFQEALSKTPTDAKFIMEATGTYYLNLAFFLDERGQYLSVVNPICTKSHMRTELRRSKSDKSDSFSLARFGQEKSPDRWLAMTPEVLQMRQMLATCDSIRLAIAGFGNRIHAMEQCVYSSVYAIGALEGLQEKLEAQLKETMDYLEERATKTMSRTIQIIESIPGIGRETALRMAVTIGDFQRFSSSRKLVSFAGLSPTQSQSGISVHSKGTISRMGGHKIRSALYVCSWSAIRCNPPCKAMWERMKEKGKPGKVILMAVVNKLIRMIYSMVINDTVYNPNFLAQAA
jgi:transposase